VPSAGPEKLTYPSIGDYAIIGDCRAAALVCRDGSIDWMCLPHFDSPSVFGALLDSAHGGRFIIHPTTPAEITRQYIENTNVLETTFKSESGTFRVTDFFTVANEPDKGRLLWPDHELLRIIECVEGEVEVEVGINPRPNYARTTPRIETRRNMGCLVHAGRQTMLLRHEVPLGGEGQGPGLVGTARLRAGEQRSLSLSFMDMAPQIILPLGEHVRERLDCTVNWWKQWADQCQYNGPYREQVVRSALALKLMTYAPSGAVIAAPTTSLPECIGGERNWDYRYCWLRDASMTLRSLMDIGYSEEARAFLAWMLHATAMDRPEMRIMYDVHGGTHMRERELDHLEGYRRSKPVRIGNDARHQLQLDVYGTVVDAAYEYYQRGGELSREACRMLSGFGIQVCKTWDQPDEGIWEIRSGRRHHTLSKAMCWVTLDRLLRMHEKGCLKIPVEKFRENKQLLREQIEHHGYNEDIDSYVDVFDGEHVDAGLLLLGLYRYVDPASPRMMSTCRKVVEQLGVDGLIYRYNVSEKKDAFDAAEGTFALCGFWNVQLLAEMGETGRAVRGFRDLLQCANDVGLYAEEIDARTREPLGNFPQAYTHVGLINAACALRHAEPDAEMVGDENGARKGVGA